MTDIVEHEYIPFDDDERIADVNAFLTQRQHQENPFSTISSPDDTLLTPEQEKQVADLQRRGAIWEPRDNRLKIHTYFLAQYSAEQGIRFITASRGRDLLTPNAYMYPLKGGGWLVLRYGVNPTEHESWKTSKDGTKRYIEWAVPKPQSKDTSERFRPYSCYEYDALDIHIDYVFEGVVAKDVPGVIGGLAKTCKSTIATDFGISAATGLPFLNHFPNNRIARSVMFAGEGGKIVLQETMRRIAASKGMRLRDIDGFYIVNAVPSLSSDKDMKEAIRIAQDCGADFIIFDPFYMMLAFQQAQMASNVFAMGSMFQRLNEMCVEAKATPIILHHFKKTGTNNSTPDIHDLSQAGCAEFAGQWLMLSRETEYDDDPGKHELVMRVGSRLGHTGRWNVFVDETSDAGKVWVPTVTNGSKQAQEALRRNEAKKRILDVLTTVYKNGASQTQLREYSGVRAREVPDLLVEMLHEGSITNCTLRGKGCDCYKLNTLAD